MKINPYSMHANRKNYQESGFRFFNSDWGDFIFPHPYHAVNSNIYHATDEYIAFVVNVAI